MPQLIQVRGFRQVKREARLGRPLDISGQSTPRQGNQERPAEIRIRDRPLGGGEPDDAKLPIQKEHGDLGRGHEALQRAGQLAQLGYLVPVLLVDRLA
jgi:hypothetical protein